MKRRKRHTPSEIARLVSAYRQSGLSAARFAEQHKISTTTLYNWLKKAGNQPPIIEVQPPKFAADKMPVCTFIWADGRRLEFRADVPAAQLREVVKALRAAR